MPYHLIISGRSEAFRTNRFEIAAERCLNSTDNNLRDYFFRFPATRTDELLAFPALIAHEKFVSDGNVRLVKLTEIVRRGNRVRALFEPTGTELSYEQFVKLSLELDIDEFEYHRTHWAIKNVQLTDVLSSVGVTAPPLTFPPRPYVNLESHSFKVALSFPGEDRDLHHDWRNGWD